MRSPHCSTCSKPRKSSLRRRFVRCSDRARIRRALPTREFARRLVDELDAYVEARRAAAAAVGKVLRYLARFDADIAHIGLDAVVTTHPVIQLDAADNLFLFTTDRYLKWPLAIPGPGAGAEVTAQALWPLRSKRAIADCYLNINAVDLPCGASAGPWRTRARHSDPGFFTSVLNRGTPLQFFSKQVCSQKSRNPVFSLCAKRTFCRTPSQEGGGGVRFSSTGES